MNIESIVVDGPPIRINKTETPETFNYEGINVKHYEGEGHD
jgi:hypothetical protein